MSRLARFARILVLGILLSLTAWAQPEPRAVEQFAEFEARFEDALKQGDYANAAGWGRANSEAAQHYWIKFKSSRTSGTPASTIVRDRCATLLANELAKQGKSEVLTEVKRLGWYTPDLVGYHPRPRLVLDLPDYGVCVRNLGWQASVLEVAAGLDDTVTVQACSANIESIASHLEAERRAARLLDVENGTSALLSVVRQIPLQVELNRGNSLGVSENKIFEAATRTGPNQLSEEELMYFRALHRNGSVLRLEKALTRGRRLGLVGPGSMREFVYQTYEMSLRAERDLHLQAREVIAAHQRACAILQQLPDLTQQSPIGPEISVWIGILFRWNDDPQFGALARDEVGKYGPMLSRLSKPARLEGQDWLSTGRFCTNLVSGHNIMMDLLRTFERCGQGWRTRPMLAAFGDRAKFRDQVRPRLQWLAEQALADQPSAPPVRLRPIQPHFEEGAFARLMEQWCNQEMGVTAVDDMLPELYAESERWGLLARRHLGWLGWSDGRWFYLDHLFRSHPPDWQSRAVPVMASLQQDCDRMHFELGQCILLYRGALLERPQHPERALEKLTQAVNLWETYLNEVGLSSATRDQLRRTTRVLYSALTEVQIQLAKPNQALETLLREQSAESVSRGSELLAGDPKAAPLIRVRGQTQELRAQFQANVVAGRSNAQTEKLLASNKAEFHTVLNDLRSKYPTYESALAIRPVNFSQTQKYLPAEAAILQYFPTVDKLYIFVVTREKLVIREVSIGEAQLKTGVAHLQAELYKPTRVEHGAYSWSAPDPYLEGLRKDLTGLYKLLVAPVEADLEGCKLLAFVPTGSLHYVPFAALARPKGDGLEFLVERYPCVNLVKAADLEHIGHPATAADGGLLALANPDGSLPGSEREVAQIAGLFSKVQRFVGQDFTAARLKQIEAKTSYLHLATHGILDASNPKQSYLVMFGKEGSNHLTIPEIYGLNLEGIRLVTLSACKTGLESEQPGSELCSLADAFSVAGSNSVVASLWSVSDDATEKLMFEFYRGIQGKTSLAESLQKAELAVLKEPATAHPFFWAPFIILGDWR